MVFASLDSTTVNTAVIIGAAIIVGFFTLIRGRSDVWKSNYEAEKARADDLEAKVKVLETKVAKLEALPNLDRLAKLITAHDKVSKSNALAISAILEKVAKKL